jgi:hypothetical protein
MTASMRIIIATIAVAVLASPVMAQTEPHRHVSAASIARAHGAVTRTHAHQVVQREPVDSGRIDPQDCSIKSILTQCGFAH